ncbi:MAG TPA: hypothetical protein VLZ29_04410 [Sulfurimonas sp.]|uniref:FMN-binding protein n=1 Tax=Sulfurimonas sp. TaxID=2022749 RepID=UPI002C14DE9C|nr:FMN-binding protein [Sulfurimonas sp.]HUH42336.1 hypothetical protein [Sulfurimonas sp.]
MKYISLFFLIFLALPLSAKLLILPAEAMQKNYGSDAKISEENLLLTNAQAQKIQQESKIKLASNIVKVFKATKNSTTLGYGILINGKVRSKNAVVLYIISGDSALKSIEIIAFNEPLEYLPSKKWVLQLSDTGDVPNITGATMSAKNLIDGSKTALAIYNEVLKGK